MGEEKSNREKAFEEAIENINNADLGVLDNRYTFSKRIIDIADKTALEKTSLGIAKLSRPERTWALSRLKKIEMVDEILTDEDERNRAKVYFLSGVLNTGIMSRTDDAWLIKSLIDYEKEKEEEPTMNNKSGITMTDDEINKQLQKE